MRPRPPRLSISPPERLHQELLAQTGNVPRELTRDVLLERLVRVEPGSASVPRDKTSKSPGPPEPPIGSARGGGSPPSGTAPPSRPNPAPSPRGAEPRRRREPSAWRRRCACARTRRSSRENKVGATRSRPSRSPSTARRTCSTTTSPPSPTTTYEAALASPTGLVAVRGRRGPRRAARAVLALPRLAAPPGAAGAPAAPPRPSAAATASTWWAPSPAARVARGAHRPGHRVAVRAGSMHLASGGCPTRTPIRCNTRHCRAGSRRSRRAHPLTLGGLPARAALAHDARRCARAA